MRKSGFILTLLLTFLFMSGAFAQITDTLKVYFEINSHSINGGDLNSLNKLLEKPNLRNIKIFAYTDFLGSFEYNQQLSEQRAKSVSDFLVAKGISRSEILESRGMGIHQFSSYENRRNQNDRGIREHRMVEIIFTCDSGMEARALEIKPVEEKIIPVITAAPEDEPVIIDLKTIKETDLVEGNNIVLKNIIFEGGTPTFKPESDEALKDLLSIMREYPNLKIEIQGHICCQSANDPDGYDYVNDNNKLSENRARAVYEFLRDNGIETNRMTYKGFGSRYKLYPLERTSYEQSQNRRVEIKIISN